MAVAASATRTSRATRAGELVPAKLGRGARQAAEHVVQRNVLRIEVLGQRVELPSGEQLAFLAGLGVLAALEIIEWPVVGAIAIGHALAQHTHGRLLREFGEALEEA